MRIDQLPLVTAVQSTDTLAVNDGVREVQASVGSIANAVRDAVYGAPLTAATAAAMTDHAKVYVYTGSESGYTAGHWYYWNGSAWTDGGAYNSTAVQTDASLRPLERPSTMWRRTRRTP